MISHIENVARKRGYKIILCSGGVSVDEFDDVNVASITTPTITTIHQPTYEMAELSVDILIDAAEGKTVARRTILPVTLVKRESTGF